MSVRTRQEIRWLFVLLLLAGSTFSFECWGLIADESEQQSPAAVAASSDLDSFAPLEPVLAEEQVYEVRKKVSDYPDGEDLSTPESAYATILRAYATEGNAVLMRLSIPIIVPELTRREQRLGSKQPLPKEEALRYLKAEIMEVHVLGKNHVAVVARMPFKCQDIDVRLFDCVSGRWLNVGNGCFCSLKKAREAIARRSSHQAATKLRDNRPPVADPTAHLKPFADFLQREAKEPQQFVLDAIGKHRVVILSEVHNRPRYWAFNAALVRSPEFAGRAGVIYMEYPSNDQGLIDHFLAAAKFDPEPVIEMLRDMHEAGWPDQPVLDFFRAVWEVSQKLPQPQRLRIVLADMARPWREIKKREDWRKYNVDRDQYMAESIVRDLQQHDVDTRHALFIVGYAHAMVNITRPGGEPMKSAGWHLREKLGAENVFAIFPHSPVITNRGDVHGRIALGLFETAFAALGNKPMAFPLDHGPFGQQVFDADPDRLTCDPFSKGYQAYLYLRPVEGEIRSPLIPGFYTDAFVREVDRRWRVMFGKGLVEAGLIEHLDGASYAAVRSRYWGQPRRGWSADRLGPLEAWHYGSHYRDAMRKRIPSPQATTGKVIELYDVFSKLESLANLAKGTVMACDPKRFRGEDPQSLAWLKEQEIDLIAIATPPAKDQGIVGLDMTAAKIDNSRFDILDIDEATHALKNMDKKQNGIPGTIMSIKLGLPVTYAIRIRDGSFGVLQIEDARVSETPAVFRLRYKLFEKSQ